MLDLPGYRVSAFFWSKSGDWFLIDPGLEASAFLGGVPRSATPLHLIVGSDGGFVRTDRRRSTSVPIDVALVCCHGGPGEDGTLQATLDLAHIPHAGPSAAGAALGMDKFAFGSVVENAGLPMLPRRLLSGTSSGIDFSGPYIVKPRFGGSSIGIEVVSDLSTAQALLKGSVHLAAGAVIEPYMPELFDLQIALRSWPKLELSAIERPLRSSISDGSGEILGYHDKYVGGEGMLSAPRELPASVVPEMQQTIIECAKTVAELHGLRGVARLDYLSDGASVWVNEINTIPGSLSRHLWVAPPIAFGQLLSDLIAEAQSRPARAFETAGADGTILQGASSIAAKLA
jgi:D-alanine-D-alanine ligase